MLERGDRMSIWDIVSGKSAGNAAEQKTEGERQIRFVQDGRNSWRIVYAD